MTKKIRVGVFGASGYTGFALLKMLRQHKHAQIVFATSEQSAGQDLSDVFPTLIDDVKLVRAEDAPINKIDAAFLCLPHEHASRLTPKLLEAGVRVIDLSADFRLNQAELYSTWYKFEHSSPELLQHAVYGLSEFNRAAITEARLIANPGCYPTCTLLGVLPALQVNALQASQTLIIDAKSGVSGAGRKPATASHYVEAHDNITPYNIGSAHRHVPEIRQSFRQFAQSPIDFVFAPHLVPLSQGMMTTIYSKLNNGWSVERLHHHYAETYTSQAL